MIVSGKVYKLVNAKAGTVLELSESDNKSIVGNDWHDGANQKWRLEQEEGAWVLRNLATGLHLGVEDEAKNGTPVVVFHELFRWDVLPDEESSSTYRLFVLNTHYNLDLSRFGNSTPGTPITLWAKWHPGKNQTWRFEEA